MTERSWFERPLARTVALLTLLAYVPALTAAPGRMPSDSKLYLYLDPGRFLGDAASSFDGRQFAGWVPHQHIAYLWPSGPWFWVFEALGVPDWVAHRLWIGSLMLAAGLGVRWCARTLGLTPAAAATAAVVYQLSLYVLPYVSRTSVMLLPWAGLGWIVALTVRATRRRTWGDPAAIALVVFTVGAVNATALAMIVPAPVLWLIHATWQRSIGWRDAFLVAARTAALTLAVSLWWIVMLLVQGRHGTDVLPYSESLADVSLTATSAEVWRGLGYWLFYVRDPYAATTTESLRYLSSSPAILVSYLVPIMCLVGLVFVRWTHRRFAALLVVSGIVLAVGVHPVGDRSPLMRVLAGDDDSGLALALRSSTRALPLMMLGLALAAGALVAAAADVQLPRVTWRADAGTAVVIGALAVANLPALWTGAFVDEALERDQTPPTAWAEASQALDASGNSGRVLQLPGQEFGAYRWGYTVDQPLPGLTDKPLVTRDLLPLGSAGAMDLLYALDDRVQEGTLEPESIGPVARLLGVDTIWATNDAAFDRFRTARPEIVSDLVASAPGVGDARSFGEVFVNRPDLPVTDGRAVADPRVGQPARPVELYDVDQPGAVVRAAATSVVVSGSGDGLVDLAAAGLLDEHTVVRYSASLEGGDLAAALAEGTGLVVTDSNRDQARHWRSSQDTRGYTEPGGPDADVLRPVASDERLPVFETATANTQTIALQRGPVAATATSYGEPFAYLPEHRPFMAIDGDSATSWIVGEHGDPIGESLRLELATPAVADGASATLLQPVPEGDRRITSVMVSSTLSGGDTELSTVALDDRSTIAPGQPIALPGSTVAFDITIDAVGGGEPGTASAVAGVGFAEVDLGRGATIEVVRPPHDALAMIADDTALSIAFTRLRVDAMNRWRADPEPHLVREFDVASPRTMTVDATVRIDPRATDETLADLFGWPVTASSRLQGSLRNVGAAAFDGDLDTAWITPFDGAEGAVLMVEGVAQPVERVEVRQPIATFSRITALTVAVGTDSRTVELVADAAGGATAVVDPPLASGDVTITIAAVDPVTTVDRRFGDVVELPAAISELVMAGGPSVTALRSASVDVECLPVATFGDREVAVSFGVRGDGWLDGAAIAATTCTGPIDLSTGSHLLRSSREPNGITLDRVVMADAGADSDETSTSVATPTATVVSADRFTREVELSGCEGGCWLVLGEGFSDAWSADGPDGSLGRQELVDGGFNGWWIAPTTGAVTIDLSWSAQRSVTIALIVSVFAVIGALALVVVDRRRHRARNNHSETPRPAFVTTGPASGTSGWLTLAAWVVFPALLIGPSWAIWGLIAGLAAGRSPVRRIAELTALAAVVVLGASVTFLERRDAPLPNGGWPTTFESLHGLGMFAMVCLFVSALFADDAEPDQSRDGSSATINPTITEPSAADDNQRYEPDSE